MSAVYLPWVLVLWLHYMAMMSCDLYARKEPLSENVMQCVEHVTSMSDCKTGRL